MNETDGIPLDEGIMDTARAILAANPDLAKHSDDADRAFEKALSEGLEANGMSDPSGGAMQECSAWCAHHGDIGTTTRILLLYKMVLDHQQSIPGPHAIRRVCEDVF